MQSYFLILIMPQAKSPPIEISDDDADAGACQSAAPSQAAIM